MSLSAPDPYAVLGIPRDATDEQVQRAYRRLAKRYHPDLHPDARTNLQMQRINRAWETLSTPASRARYDAESTLSKPARSEHWSTRPRHSAPSGAGWTAAAAARVPPPPASRPYDDGAQDWRVVIGSSVLALLLLVAIFSGVLPTPLFGLVLLIGARSILARFD